jgi:hypothetical protein
MTAAETFANQEDYCHANLSHARFDKTEFFSFTASGQDSTGLTKTE